MNAELRHQPIAGEGADNPNHHVIDEPETGPVHDVPGQPSRRKADQ